MKTPLSLEQQRDYVRRLQVGWTAASATQLDALTENERRGALDETNRLSGMKSDFPKRMKLFRKQYGLK